MEKFLDRYKAKNKELRLSEELGRPSSSNLRIPSPESVETSTDTGNKPGPISSNSYTNETANEKYSLNKVKKMRKYNFSPYWLQKEEFKDWLMKTKDTKGSDSAYCKVCCQVLTTHKNDLLRHSKSQKHIKNTREISSSKKISNMIMPSSVLQHIRRAEIKLTALLIAANLPFLLTDKLSPFCGNIFSECETAKKLSLHRTKATCIAKNILGANLKKNLYNYLRRKDSFFSVIMDETTDQGTIKQCAIAVIYIDEELNVKTRFLDMIETRSSTAKDLYETLINCLNCKNIPINNMVGFSSDTTNVMVGDHNSVFAFIKRNLPNVFCVKCSCHMIHLAASKACLCLPRSVEDLLRNIGAHFSRSYHRQQKFKEFQEYFNVGIHKILSPSITRWLSVKECVDRVLEQYVPLQAYLRLSVFEDPSRTTETMLKAMDNKFTKIYLEFMSYVLELLTDFNKMFQGESPLLYKLQSEVKKILKTIFSNFLDLDYIKRNDVFTLDHTKAKYILPLNKLYFGVQAHDSLNCLLENSGPEVNEEFTNFQKSCLNFYIELANQIKKRFDFTDPLYEYINIVDPTIAQKFEIKSLRNMLNRFPTLNLNLQELDNEWRQHALLNFEENELDPKLMPEIYWKKVFKLKNAAGIEIFTNLKQIIKVLLTLPFSNASVERVFSKLKLIKTSLRSNINTDTIVNILISKEGIEEAGGILEFEPSQEMINTNVWNSTNILLTE